MLTQSTYLLTLSPSSTFSSYIYTITMSILPPHSAHQRTYQDNCTPWSDSFPYPKSYPATRKTTPLCGCAHRTRKVPHLTIASSRFVGKYCSPSHAHISRNQFLRFIGPNPPFEHDLSCPVLSQPTIARMQNTMLGKCINTAIFSILNGEQESSLLALLYLISCFSHHQTTFIV
jgi:hypothetical protein